MKTERICPHCQRIHTSRNNTCYRCYYRRSRDIDVNAPDLRRRTRSQDPRRRPDMLCAPGLCNQPATEYRQITIGGVRSSTQHTTILWLCPACAALHDAEEQRTLAAIIPTRRTTIGGVYHC